MPQGALGHLVLPGVTALISFLAYGSQILFRYIEPSPLEQKQAFIFNALVCCIWITYIRTCFTNPGWVPSARTLDHAASEPSVPSERAPKWCRKCKAFKPPRAHHCKICKRCIPKMDHHCPWTANCVSHRTFPHFFRFLFYATASMIYLEHFLFLRVAVVWAGRNLPSYLGPTPTQLVFLFVFCVVNSITLFALAILLIRNVWCLGSNVTTIEGWEIERHETLVRRARARGGYLDGPDGTRVRISKQEFPYDIGICQNIRQAMGDSFFSWLWPFTPTPSNESGLEFETNGFEDPSLPWPPPDPDRMPRSGKQSPFKQPFVYDEDSSTVRNDLVAFRRRQREDLKRYDRGATTSIPYPPTDQHYTNADPQRTSIPSPPQTTADSRSDGKGWRNYEGDSLDDFGVDEEAESFDDDDDVPLAEVLRRRRYAQLDS